ncbi:MAG: divergent polysaccharide deacetylase family protein [Alphaproteobacteria bacterium]
MPRRSVTADPHARRRAFWSAAGWSAAAGVLIGGVLSLAWLGTVTPPGAAPAVVAPAIEPAPAPAVAAPTAQAVAAPTAPAAADPVVPPAAAPVTALPVEPADPLEPVPPKPPPQQASVVRPPPIDAPAWRRHAVPPRGAADGPRVAIVIDDLGPNRRGTLEAIALPGPLTLAFLPYAAGLPRLVEQARGAGHEVIVHLPMEPQNGQDPGPDALLVELPPAELRRRIAANLDRFGDYVGVNNHMGSRFTADRPAMALLVEEVARRGLLLLDSRTTARSVAGELARSHGVPFAARDVFLDNDASALAVDAQLVETERTARRKGRAIAIGHPHPSTLASLATWLATAEERGFRLVPVSQLVRVPATTD